MLDFLVGNSATIVISCVLIGFAVLAILNILKDKKKGACSGGCSGCQTSAQCHKN